MGMLPPRMCRKCLALAEPGTTLCAAHRDAAAVADAERSRNSKPPYNRNSKAWRAARGLTLFRYPQCAQIAEDGTRCPELATEAHHVVKATDWIAQGGDYLDQDNLVGLCRADHTRHTAAERTGVAVPGSFAAPSNEWSPVV
jgi:RNA polymerase subunit RPABC4/transcription elongation factor Spt4